MTKENLKEIIKQTRQLDDDTIRLVINVLKEEMEYRKVRAYVSEVLDNMLEPYKDSKK